MFPKIGGKNPKWMLKYIKMDDLGVPPIFGNTHMAFEFFQRIQLDVVSTSKRSASRHLFLADFLWCLFLSDMKEQHHPPNKNDTTN